MATNSIIPPHLEGVAPCTVTDGDTILTTAGGPKCRGQGSIGMSAILALSLAGLATPAHSAPARMIRVEATVQAPVAKVWRAWTTTEGAVEFFAPKANIQLAIGDRTKSISTRRMNGRARGASRFSATLPKK